jgi:hypothetical protein
VLLNLIKWKHKLLNGKGLFPGKHTYPVAECCTHKLLCGRKCYQMEAYLWAGFYLNECLILSSKSKILSWKSKVSYYVEANIIMWKPTVNLQQGGVFFYVIIFFMKD